MSCLELLNPLLPSTPNPSAHAPAHTDGPKSRFLSMAGATTDQPYSSAHAQLLATLTQVEPQEERVSGVKPGEKCDTCQLVNSMAM